VSERFENINLLRAFAAMAVLVYHVIELRPWPAFPIDGPLVVFRIGWIGVDLFYVISGFVITLSALALRRRDPERFARRYWARRLARIYPLYLVTCVLWVAFFKPDFFDASVKAWAWQIVSHLAFLHTLTPWTFGSINGANWTLAIEMHFYVAVALLVPWIARTPGWRIWLGCIAIAWAWRGAMVAILGTASPSQLFQAVAQLPGVIDEFGAGIFLACLVDRGGAPSARAGLAWTAAAVAVGTVCMGVYWSHASYWDVPAMVIGWRTLNAAFLLCVVAAAVHLPELVRMLPVRPIRYLGVVSYGVYLWHLFAIRWVQGSPALEPAQALAAVIGVAVALAALSWHTFERPILERGRRYDGGAPRSPVARPDRLQRTLR